MFLSTLLISLSGCNKDDELTASVSINAVGSDLGGDVTGNGGSTTTTYTWNNPLTTADYNMDMTAGSGGSFQIMIADADGTVVLTQALVKGQGDDSRSGVTGIGSAGDWTITVTLTNFVGDGSFSLSPGN